MNPGKKCWAELWYVNQEIISAKLINLTSAIRNITPRNTPQQSHFFMSSSSMAAKTYSFKTDPKASSNPLLLAL